MSKTLTAEFLDKVKNHLDSIAKQHNNIMKAAELVVEQIETE